METRGVCNQFTSFGESENLHGSHFETRGRKKRGGTCKELDWGCERHSDNKTETNRVWDVWKMLSVSVQLHQWEVKLESSHVDRLGWTTHVIVKKMDFILSTVGDQGLALSTESHSPFCYNENSQLCGGGDRENNKLRTILDSCSQEHPPVFCVDENEDKNVLILLWKTFGNTWYLF